MTNPLDGPSKPSFPTLSGPAYGSQAWCDWRNTVMARRDIEWVTDGTGGAYLRDRPDWTARQTTQIERTAQTERREWKRRHTANQG